MPFEDVYFTQFVDFVPSLSDKLRQKGRIYLSGHFATPYNHNRQVNVSEDKKSAEQMNISGFNNLMTTEIMSENRVYYFEFQCTNVKNGFFQIVIDNIFF